MDYQKQVRKAFAPSDIKTLVSLPECEQRYRLLRNEWLTLHSRYKQLTEWKNQAIRSKNWQEIEDADKAIADVSTKMGMYKKLTLIAKMRAEAEVFRDMAQAILPKDVVVFLDDCVREQIGRSNDEVVRRGKNSSIREEDYALFDDIVSRWTTRTETI